MYSGQTGKYLCNECLREFELTLEPAAKDAGPAEDDDGQPGEVQCCPFCGSELVDLV